MLKKTKTLIIIIIITQYNINCDRWLSGQAMPPPLESHDAMYPVTGSSCYIYTQGYHHQSFWTECNL